MQRSERSGLEYLIDAPASAGAPMLLCLHGRGSTPEKLRAYSAEIGGDFLRVLPQGPLVSEAGRAWYLKGEERAAQVAASRSALVGLLDELKERYALGPERVAVWGFSQGGTLSLEVGLSARSPLAATVCVGGILDGATRDDASRLRQARGREFFLVHGVADDVVSHQEARVAYRALNAEGARVELAELPMRHELSPVALGAVRGYLASALTGPPRTARA